MKFEQKTSTAFAKIGASKEVIKKTATIKKKNLLLLWRVKAIHLTRRKRTRIPRSPRRRIIEEVFEVPSPARGASRNTTLKKILLREQHI